MRRTRTTLPRSVGRLRAPILAFLVGMGFVVQGLAGAAEAAALASISGARSVVQEAVHPAAPASTLLPLGDVRPAGSRSPGGPGRWNAPGDADGAPRRSTGPTVRSGRPASGSPAASAASAFARDALRRSGRTSAPSTAPPASPS